MIVAGIYSFNGGKEIVEQTYADELAEILEVIAAVDSEVYKTKASSEKTMPGRLLYHPSSTYYTWCFGHRYSGSDSRGLSLTCPSFTSQS